MMSHPRRRSPESSRRRRKARRDSRGQSVVNDDAACSILDQRGEYAAVVPSTTSAPDSPYASHEQRQPSSSPRPEHQHPDDLAPISMRSNDHTPNLPSTRSMPVPIPADLNRPHRPKHRRGSGSSSERLYSSSNGSSSSSSYLDISRWYPSYRRSGGVIRAFFQTPSEHRPRRRGSGRRKPRKAKPTIFGFGNNSSSSSVNSDMAYGMGFLRKNKTRSGGNRSHGSGAASATTAGNRRQTSDGRPATLQRRQTDEEILEIGRKLAEVARKQNREDLRASGKRTPSHLMAAAGVWERYHRESNSAIEGSNQRNAATVSDLHHRHRREDPSDWEDWESASDEEDDSSIESDSNSALAYGHTELQTPQPVSSSMGGRNAPSPDPREYEARKSTAVDPKLFGPSNSLHDFVNTPCGFKDGGDSHIAPGPLGVKYAGSTESASLEARPMQRVFPLSTSDPNLVEAARSSPSPMSAQQQQQQYHHSQQQSTAYSALSFASPRPEPIPIQAPVPIVPVPSRMFEEERLRDHAEPSEPSLEKEVRHHESFKDNPTFVETALVGAGVAALGAALLAGRKKTKEKELEEVGHGRAERYGHEDKRADGTKLDDANTVQELALLKEIERLERALGRTDKAREQRKRDSKRDSGGQPRELPEDDHTFIVADADPRVEDERDRIRRSKSSRYSRRSDEPRRHQNDVEYAREGRGEDSRRREHEPPEDFDVFQYQVPDESFQSHSEALRASSPMIIDVTPSPSPAPGQSSSSRHSHMDEEEQEARHIYKEARHSTAPIPEAAMAAAIAATEHSHWHHHEEEERGRSSTRTADHIQEAANQYYHARRIAEREQQSRSRSKSVDSDPSVVDSYRDDEDNRGRTIPRIITPPEMAGRAKKNKYSEPDADVTFDNKMVPRQLLQYWPQQAPVRDPSAQRDRPILNLVMPTPVPTPTPEKQVLATAKVTTRAPQAAASSGVMQPAGEVVETIEVIESPTIPKRVSWGPSETQSYVVESADEVSREPSPDGRFKSTVEKSSGGGWGTIAAAIVGASTAAAVTSDYSSDTQKHVEQHVEEEPTARYHERSSGTRSPPKERPILPAGTSSRIPTEEPEEPPPMPSTKPPSPPRNSYMPGAFDEDIDFAATLAAGLEHSGFDPEIVIENPAYRRRDSPPGSNEDFSQVSYMHPFAETVSDLGVISFDDSSRPVSEPGYVIGEVAGTPIDERHAPLTDPVLEAEWPEPVSTTSPRRSKKGKRAAEKTQAESPPVDAEEDEWASAPSSHKSKKSKGKKSKRASVTLGDTESPTNDSLVSARSEDSIHAQETSDDWEAPKKTRKSKRSSKSYDNEEATDKDAASSVADSRGDDYSTVSSYKDASSTISAPSSAATAKNTRSEKRSSEGGSIWGRLMGSSSNSNGDDKPLSKKDSAGTLGAGAGIAGAAAAIAALTLSDDAAEAPRKHEEEPHDSHWGLSGRSIDDRNDEPSSFRRDSNLLEDPEVAPRQIKPAIDPQFGDLLPLPPSPGAPTTSRIFVDYEDHEDLPALPDSRPGSPPGVERVALRKRDDSLKRTSSIAHSRRISSLEMAPRSPSHTAIPLQFRMSYHRSLPTTFGTRSSPVIQSPPSSASPELSPPLRKSQTRPTSWDNSREYKPLYLLEQARGGAKRAELELEDAGSDSTAAAAATTAAAAVALDKREFSPVEAEAEERQAYPLNSVSEQKPEPVEGQEDTVAHSRAGEHASRPSPVENQPPNDDTIPSLSFIEQDSPISAEPVIAVQNELALASSSSLPESNYATPVESPSLAPLEEQREQVLEESNEELDMFVTPQPVLEGQDAPEYIPAGEIVDVQHLALQGSDSTVSPGRDAEDDFLSAEPSYPTTYSPPEEDFYPSTVEATDLPVPVEPRQSSDPSVAYAEPQNSPSPVESEPFEEKEAEMFPSFIEPIKGVIQREAEEHTGPHSELTGLGILPVSETFHHENINQSPPTEDLDKAKSMASQRDEEYNPLSALPDAPVVLPEVEIPSGYASSVEPSSLPAFVEVEKESRSLPAQPEDIPLPIETEDEDLTFLDEVAATKTTEQNDNQLPSAELQDLALPQQATQDDVFAYPAEPYHLPGTSEAAEEPTSPHFLTSLSDDPRMPEEVNTERHRSSALDFLPAAAMLGAGVLLGREIAGHPKDVTDKELRDAVIDDEAPDQPALPLEESRAHFESETASPSEPVAIEAPERAVYNPEVDELIKESPLPLDESRAYVESEGVSPSEPIDDEAPDQPALPFEESRAHIESETASPSEPIAIEAPERAVYNPEVDELIKESPLPLDESRAYVESEGVSRSEPIDNEAPDSTVHDPEVAELLEESTLPLEEPRAHIESETLSPSEPIDNEAPERAYNDPEVVELTEESPLPLEEPRAHVESETLSPSEPIDNEAPERAVHDPEVVEPTEVSPLPLQTSLEPTAGPSEPIHIAETDTSQPIPGIPTDTVNWAMEPAPSKGKKGKKKKKSKKGSVSAATPPQTAPLQFDEIVSIAEFAAMRQRQSEETPAATSVEEVPADVDFEDASKYLGQKQQSGLPAEGDIESVQPGSEAELPASAEEFTTPLESFVGSFDPTQSVLVGEPSQIAAAGNDAPRESEFAETIDSRPADTTVDPVVDTIAQETVTPLSQAQPDAAREVDKAPATSNDADEWMTAPPGKNSKKNKRKKNKRQSSNLSKGSVDHSALAAAGAASAAAAIAIGSLADERLNDNNRGKDEVTADAIPAGQQPGDESGAVPGTSREVAGTDEVQETSAPSVIQPIENDPLQEQLSQVDTPGLTEEPTLPLALSLRDNANNDDSDEYTKAAQETPLPLEDGKGWEAESVAAESTFDPNQDATGDKTIVDEPIPDEPYTVDPILEPEEEGSNDQVPDEPVLAESVIEEPAFNELGPVETAFLAPAIDAPGFEEPTFEEVSTEKAIADAPFAREHAFAEPADDGPAIDEQFIDEPAVDQPFFDDAAAEELVIDEPVIDEPVVLEAAVLEPVDEPSVLEPSVLEPSVLEPMDKPSVLEAAVHEPMDEPSILEAAVHEPVDEPSILEAAVYEPMDKPSVLVPSFLEPSILEAAVYEPMDEPSVLEPSVGETATDKDALDEASSKTFAAEQATADKSLSAKPTVIEPPAGETATDQYALDKATSEMFAAEQTTFDQSLSDEPPVVEPVPAESILDHIAIIQPIIYEPVVDEPIVHEPFVGETSTDQSLDEDEATPEIIATEQATISKLLPDEPNVFKPILAENTLDHNALIQPTIDEPVVDGPAMLEVAIEEPSLEEVATESAAVDDSNIAEDASNKPIMGEAVVNKPVFSETIRDKPVFIETALDEPTVNELTKASSTYEELAADRPINDELIPEEHALAAHTPAAHTPEEFSADTPRSDDSFVEEVSMESSPVKNVLVESVPVEEESKESLPVESLPVEDLPVESLPIESLPVEGHPVERYPVEGLPVESLPVEGLPVEGLPVESLPIENLPVESLPVEGLPVEHASIKVIPKEEILAEIVSNTEPASTEQEPGASSPPEEPVPTGLLSRKASKKSKKNKKKRKGSIAIVEDAQPTGPSSSAGPVEAQEGTDTPLDDVFLAQQDEQPGVFPSETTGLDLAFQAAEELGPALGVQVNASLPTNVIDSEDCFEEAQLSPEAVPSREEPTTAETVEPHAPSVDAESLHENISPQEAHTVQNAFAVPAVDTFEPLSEELDSRGAPASRDFSAADRLTFEPSINEAPLHEERSPHDATSAQQAVFAQATPSAPEASEFHIPVDEQLPQEQLSAYGMFSSQEKLPFEEAVLSPADSSLHQTLTSHEQDGISLEHAVHRPPENAVAPDRESNIPESQEFEEEVEYLQPKTYQPAFHAAITHLPSAPLSVPEMPSEQDDAAAFEPTGDDVVEWQEAQHNISAQDVEIVHGPEIAEFQEDVPEPSLQQAAGDTLPQDLTANARQSVEHAASTESVPFVPSRATQEDPEISEEQVEGLQTHVALENEYQGQATNESSFLVDQPVTAVAGSANQQHEPQELEAPADVTAAEANAELFRDEEIELANLKRRKSKSKNVKNRIKALERNAAQRARDAEAVAAAGAQAGGERATSEMQQPDVIVQTGTENEASAEVLEVADVDPTHFAGRNEPHAIASISPRSGATDIVESISYQVAEEPSHSGLEQFLSTEAADVAQSPNEDARKQREDRYVEEPQVVAQDKFEVSSVQSTDVGSSSVVNIERSIEEPEIAVQIEPRAVPASDTEAAVAEAPESHVESPDVTGRDELQTLSTGKFEMHPVEHSYRLPESTYGQSQITFSDEPRKLNVLQVSNEEDYGESSESHIQMADQADPKSQHAATEATPVDTMPVSEDLHELKDVSSQPQDSVFEEDTEVEAPLNLRQRPRHQTPVEDNSDDNKITISEGLPANKLLEQEPLTVDIGSSRLSDERIFEVTSTEPDFSMPEGSRHSIVAGTDKTTTSDSDEQFAIADAPANITVTEDQLGLTVPEEEPLTVDFESSRLSDEEISEPKSAEPPVSAPEDSRHPIVAESGKTTTSDYVEESAAADVPAEIAAEQTSSPEWLTRSMDDDEQSDLSAPVEAHVLSAHQRQVNDDLGNNLVFETTTHAHGSSSSPVPDDVLDEFQTPSVPLEPTRGGDIDDVTITSRDNDLEGDHSSPTTEDVSQINDKSLSGMPSETTQERGEQHIDSHWSKPVHDMPTPSYNGFGDLATEPVTQDVPRSTQSPVIEYALPEATDVAWASYSLPADVMPVRSSTDGEDLTPALEIPLPHDTFPDAEASENEALSTQARNEPEPWSTPVADLGAFETPSHEDIQAQEASQSPREDVSSAPMPWSVPVPSGNEENPQSSRLGSDDGWPPSPSIKSDGDDDMPCALEDAREIHNVEYGTPLIEAAARPPQSPVFADNNLTSDQAVAVESQEPGWVRSSPSPTGTLRSTTLEEVAPDASATGPELQATIDDEDDEDVIASAENNKRNPNLENEPSVADDLQHPQFDDKQWANEVSEPWAFEATKHNEAVAESDPGAELQDNTAVSIKSDSSWHGGSAGVPDDTEGLDQQIESPIEHHRASSGSPVPTEVGDRPSSDKENDFLSVQRTAMRPESPVPWEDHTSTLATPADETFVTPAEEVPASTFITPAEEPSAYLESSIPVALAGVSQWQEPIASVARRNSKKDEQKKRHGGGSSSLSVDFGSTPTTPTGEAPAFEEEIGQQGYEAQEGQGDLSGEVDMDIEPAMHHSDVAMPPGHHETDHLPFGQNGRQILQMNSPDTEDHLREVTEFVEPQDNFHPDPMLPQEHITLDSPTLARKMSQKEKREAEKKAATSAWEDQDPTVAEEQIKAMHSTPDEDAPVPSTGITVEDSFQDQARENSSTGLYQDEEPRGADSPPTTDVAADDTWSSPLSYQELNKDENGKGKATEVPMLERKELPLYQDMQGESRDNATITSVDYPELDKDKFGDITEAPSRASAGDSGGEETIEAGQSSLAIPGTELNNKKFRAATPDIWDDDEYFKPRVVASGAASPNMPTGRVELQPAFRSELDQSLDERSKDERPLVGLGLIHRHSSIFQEDDRHTPKLLTMGLDSVSVESMAANEVKPLGTPQSAFERSWESPRSSPDDGKEQPASATASQLSQKSSVALLAEKFGGAKKGNVPRPTSMAPDGQAQVGDDNVSATNSQPDQDTEEFTPQTPGQAAGQEKVSLEPVVLGAGAHLGSEVVSGGLATQTLPTVNLPDEDTDEDIRLLSDVPIITTTDIDEPQSQDLATPRSLSPASDSGSWHHRLDESALPAAATQDEEPRGMFTSLPRSLSRGLPPVREEPQEEEAGFEKPMMRLTAGRRSPELNRDSGMGAESPLASWARRLTDAQQRDSGVQMRDDPAPSPRHSPGSQRLSPTSIEGDSKVDEHGKQSPRSVNDARNFFLDNPYVLAAREQPAALEPLKSLKARGRVRKYPDVSPDTAALTGGAALAALLVGRRSISPTFPPDPTDFNPPSPEETQETQPTQRRVLSNTGVSRARTPEPLHLRPESPGLLRYPGVAIGAPPLRSRRSRSGDLRTLSQSSQHSQSDAGATASSPGGPGAPSRQRSPAPLSRSPTPAAAPPTPPVPASVSSISDLRKTAAAAAPTASSPSSSAAGGHHPPKNNNTSSSSSSSSSTVNKSSNPVANEGRVRSKDMADVYDGFGEGRMGSPRSPTRPHSMRRRQSMQVLELESRVEQLIAENRALNAAKDQAEQHSNNRTTSAIAERNNEIETLKQSLAFMRKEVQRLTEVNEGLNSAIAQSAVQHESRYRLLETQHAQTTKELDNVRGHHNVHGRTLEEKDAEIRSLREQLEATKEQIREMQRQILASKSADSDFLQIKDVDYFDHRCQQLCSHVQQWVLRFSKFSDMRACRLTSELNDEKIIDRLDNAVLDGSNVDRYLNDRVGRRDIFMSVTMTMIWEFVFTRYLFGMDREQRQKLKALEKLLLEVGPPHAVRQWRAVTLTLLARREAFEDQREQDTEAVVQAVFQTLSMILPPPSNLEEQILNQLRKVMREAVDLSIQMRTQRAEYVMLPPLQPEYDANGDLAEPHLFNAALMSERSGTKQAGVDDDDLQAEGAIVRAVLFPLVVKKGDDDGKGDDEVVVCPAQVIVAKPRSASRRSMRATSSDAGGVSVLRGTSPSTAPNKSNVSMQSAEYIEGGF